MNNLWVKNKWTIISTITYTLLVSLFGDITKYNMCILISSIFIIPFIQNLKIDSDSIIWNIISGFIFGFLLTTFSFTSFKNDEVHSIFSFPYHKQILYWFLLLFLNFCYSVHRNTYKIRKKSEGLTETRDDKINKILNPVRKRFLQ